MKFTLFATAIAMLAATVAAVPNPSPDLEETVWDPINKRQCCSPTRCSRGYACVVSVLSFLDCEVRELC